MLFRSSPTPSTAIPSRSILSGLFKAVTLYFLHVREPTLLRASLLFQLNSLTLNFKKNQFAAYVLVRM